MTKGNGYTHQIVMGSGSTREEVDAQIAHDRHLETSETAQLRLLREDLSRREKAVEETQRMLRTMLDEQMRAARQLLDDQRKFAEEQQRTAAETTRTLTEVILTSTRRVSELNDGIAAMAEQSASAAMAHIERAKLTADLMHRATPPAPSGWVEVGKHATDILGRLVEGVLASNPALAAKAADALGAVAQSVGQEKEQPRAPYTLADIAAARDALTDEEFAAIAQQVGVSVEGLPLEVLLEAARHKAATKTDGGLQ